MKCRDCIYMKKGYFISKPDTCVCIGVKEPFIINDINSECTEYPEKERAIIDTSSVSIGIPCLICGDTFLLDEDEQSSYKVCDKCKDAVMSLRRLLEYLNKECDDK